MRKTIIGMTALALGLTGVASAQEATYEVTITNITRAQNTSPPFVVVHSNDVELFRPGAPASEEIARMAEDGDNGPLTTLVETNAGVFDFVSAEAGLAPGESITVTVDANVNFPQLSVVGMLVGTNDTFFGLSKERLPRSSKVEFVPGFDSGTEFNSESCEYVPGPPCFAGPVHDPAEAEGMVYVNNGIQGVGDINAATYDWRNPVVKIQIERVSP